MEVANFFVWMDLRHQKSHLLAYLGQALGGPKRYTGETMRRAHAVVWIEQRHFDVVANHFAATLQELGIDDALVAAAMERIWPLAVQVVNSGSVRAAAA